jgi:hypothetical protein
MVKLEEKDMGGIYRLLMNLIRFKQSSDERADIQQRMKDDLMAQRAKTETGGGQYWLERDLKHMKGEDKPKK